MKYLPLIFLAGCASYQPIVDMQGVDRNAYHQDLSECQRYAQQVDVVGDTAKTTLVAGAFGAALGAVAGAFTGNVEQGASIGAALLGMQGAAAGAGGAAQDAENVVIRCMAGRGYSVLR